MRGKDQILKRIQIINQIRTKDFIELKGSIPEKEYVIIENTGDEWPLLLGYSKLAEDSLKSILNFSEKEIIELYAKRVIEFQQFISTPTQRKYNPYLILEDIHSLSWVLQKTEWGEVTKDIESI